MNPARTRFPVVLKAAIAEALDVGQSALRFGTAANRKFFFIY
jgi:hypothetical protein